MFAAFRERIAARLPKGRVARGIITLASGTAMAQAITICVMPIVTRLYTPAQIGVISLFLAFFGFWAATLSLRYEYALLIAKDDAESHVVHRLAIMLVVVMSVLGMPILWGLHHSGVLGFGLLPGWAPFVAVPILLGYGLFMVYRSWALRAGMVKQITKASIARSAANAATRVILGLLGGGAPGLFAAELAGAWGAMVKLARSVRTHFAPSRPLSFPRAALLLVGRRYIKFAMLETPSTWANQLTLTLPVPMIASLFGASEAGWFGLARVMVGIPNAQIGSAIADVFQMELANAVVAGDTRRARSQFYSLLRKLALIGLLPLAAVFALAPWVVPWIFGKSWSEAGLVALGIAPWLYASLVVSPLSRALSVLQAQEFKVIYDVCAILLLVAAFIVSKTRHYTFMYTVLSISAAGFLSYLVYVFVLVAVIERRLSAASS